MDYRNGPAVTQGMIEDLLDAVERIRGNEALRDRLRREVRNLGLQRADNQRSAQIAVQGLERADAEMLRTYEQLWSEVDGASGGAARAGGSLFGQKSSGSGSLFGPKSANAYGSGSLFGPTSSSSSRPLFGPRNSDAPGSLFGPKTPGSLFGPRGSGTVPGGSLFGADPRPRGSQTPGSLFGASTLFRQDPSSERPVSTDTYGKLFADAVNQQDSSRNKKSALFRSQSTANRTKPLYPDPNIPGYKSSRKSRLSEATQQSIQFQMAQAQRTVDAMGGLKGIRKFAPQFINPNAIVDSESDDDQKDTDSGNNVQTQPSVYLQRQKPLTEEEEIALNDINSANNPVFRRNTGTTIASARRRAAGPLFGQMQSQMQSKTGTQRGSQTRAPTLRPRRTKDGMERMDKRVQERLARVRASQAAGGRIGRREFGG